MHFEFLIYFGHLWIGFLVLSCYKRIFYRGPLYSAHSTRTLFTYSEYSPQQFTEYLLQWLNSLFQIQRNWKRWKRDQFEHEFRFVNSIFRSDRVQSNVCQKINVRRTNAHTVQTVVCALCIPWASSKYSLIDTLNVVVRLHNPYVVCIHNIRGDITESMKMFNSNVHS